MQLNSLPQPDDNNNNSPELSGQRANSMDAGTITSGLVLAVEDDKIGRYVLKELLEKFDYSAHLVASGEEALAAMALTNYVCVLMDIRLSGIDGFECAARIRKMQQERGKRRTPIIALTGEDTFKVRELVKEAGMDDYLCKPFDSEELRRILLRHVYVPDSPNLKVLRPLRRPDSSVDA